MWRVARSLEVLREEINAAAPRRSTVSDGSIGDAAHATRSSDHNPWVVYGGQGIVRARDFTHDPANGLDCNVLADRLAALVAVGGHPACRSGAYIIWRSRIFSFDRRGEGWRTYSGSNPHDKHLHISVATDPAGFDSTAPWFVMAEEDDMFSDEDREALARIERMVRDKGQRTNKRLARANGMLREVLTGLDELAAAGADDATKGQAQRIRRDVAKVLDALAEEAGAGDASPQP